jgi:hypothetical protein
MGSRRPREQPEMAIRSPLEAVGDVVTAHRVGILRKIFREPVADLAERICTRAGKRPDEIPHLLDVMYRFSAMSDRHAGLLAQHERMRKSHTPPLEAKIAAYDETKSVFAQIVIPMPLEYVMAVEDFLAEARRLVTQSIQLVTSQHPGGSTTEDVRLERLLHQLQKSAPIRLGDGSHQAILRRSAPEVARYLLESAKGWLGTLKLRRDQLEHLESLAGSSVEFYVVRHHGPVRSGMKVHSIEGKRMLEVMERILRGTTTLVELSAKNVSKSILKGTTESRVEIQAQFDELRRQIASGQGIAVLTIMEVDETSWSEVEAHIEGGGAPPPQYEFGEP